MSLRQPGDRPWRLQKAIYNYRIVAITTGYSCYNYRIVATCYLPLLLASSRMLDVSRMTLGSIMIMLDAYSGVLLVWE